MAGPIRSFLISTLNLMLYLVILGHAGWALDKYLDNGSIQGSNSVTLWLVGAALIAGVVGVASALSSYHHHWKLSSQAAVNAVSIISSLLTLLAFGLACKSINVGHVHNKKLRTLQSLTIIAGVTQILHTINSHLFPEDDDTNPASPLPK